MIRPCALQKKLWIFYHYGIWLQHSHNGARNCLWYFEFFFSRFTTLLRFYHLSDQCYFSTLYLMFWWWLGDFKRISQSKILRHWFILSLEYHWLHTHPLFIIVENFDCFPSALLTQWDSISLFWDFNFANLSSIRILIKFIATAILAHDRQRQGRRDQIV